MTTITSFKRRAQAEYDFIIGVLEAYRQADFDMTDCSTAERDRHIVDAVSWLELEIDFSGGPFDNPREQ